MAINFPPSPINGQTYELNGKVWTYDSSTNSWRSGDSSIATSQISTGLITLYTGKFIQ